MLLLLIALPVIILVTLAHSLLQAYAPSNLLIRRLRASRSALRMALGLGAFAYGCALAVHMVHRAIEAGAPAWLNGVGLLLALDAIKFALAATAGASQHCGAGRSLLGDRCGSET